MYTATDNTAVMLAAQFTEDTGRHILDSGGAYGRGFEHRAGMTAENFLAIPQVTIEDIGHYPYPSVSTFHLLVKHFEHTRRAAELTAEFRAYVERTPEGDAYYNAIGSVEEWLESVGITDYRADNTYNYETYLDNVLQYVEWRDDNGTTYVALSTHNGADVRGGYSDYVIYRGCECWLANADTAPFACRMCNTYFESDTRDTVDSDGCNYPDGIGPHGECPKCRWPELEGGDLWECFG